MSNVDICTRIEGHATIEYVVAKNEITAVNFKTDAFRGFEDILRGKLATDVPRIASRICGLCHASQAIASVRAVEDILGVTPPAAARAMRAVLMCGELVKSNAMHFFFQGYPDISSVFHGKTLGLEELIRKDPAFTASMFELVKLGRDIAEVFGGREVHAISQVPGGKAFTPQPKDINAGRKQLEKIGSIAWAVLVDILKEYDAAEPSEDFAYRNVAYMALSTAPEEKEGIYRQDGDLSVMFPNNSVKHVPVSRFKEFLWIEPGMREYETPLDPSMDYLVGPLARSKLGALAVDDPDLQVAVKAAERKWKDNLFFNYAMQLVDIHESAVMAMGLLDGITGETPDRDASSNENAKNEGTGIVEAPRGTLIHHYDIENNGRIGNAELLIATKINIPLINRLLTRRCRELQDKGLAIDEIRRRAGMIVRVFDPCISCATHVTRNEDRESK
nr:nickel-dependent hydrogenase large subunit [Candidatus Sigynarchaeota archaeon]